MNYHESSDRVRFATLALHAILVIVCVSTVGGCVRRTQPIASDPVPLQVNDPIVLRIGLTRDTVREIPIEDYVLGSLLAEVPLQQLPVSAAHIMAEVQAIIARTYAIANINRHSDENFDLCATTHCQVYREPYLSNQVVSAAATSAVQRTQNLVLAFNDRVAQTFFHADCGGSTSASGAVWIGDTLPYLAGVKDDFCLTAARRPWRHEVGKEELLEALNLDSSTRVGRFLTNIEIVSRDSPGRAVTIRLSGEKTKTLRGSAFRIMLIRTLGQQTLKSTRFKVTRLRDSYIFEGTGHGHGVGLCQIGAMERSRGGHASSRILSHYYPGTSLRNIQNLKS